MKFWSRDDKLHYAHKREFSFSKICIHDLLRLTDKICLETNKYHKFIKDLCSTKKSKDELINPSIYLKVET